MNTPGSLQWNLALIEEANEASALFAHGLRIIKATTYDYDDASPAMALLALGAEKLLKLTIGMARLDRGEPWPSKNHMQRIRHRVVVADAQARAQLDLTRGTVPYHIQARRAAIEADPVIAAELNALDRFGDQGRFYFLDSLGDDPQVQPSPRSIWAGMVSSILAADVDLSAQMNTQDGWKAGRQVINQAVYRSLFDWWEFYRAVWMTGVLGTQAKEFSSAIRLLRH
ncbi:hypothetical protein ODJ79_45020 [Actinoplanes sp. KI2]|uniref:hypothetical protein n=1 Tax=Actinoplanes sp. KI2 TaxID=2983315 RepID=UPI0021D60647|nr:hypothetical protein [Actinoplanes sp. KI2]MCU7730922.1 hypothetical protein [Actinoplanes sp. KI2]